jgi:hypothetical protein
MPPLDITKAAGQNCSFAPSWIFRLPEALVIFPKDDVLMVADGLPKFVWLNRPNVSKRN